MHSLSTAERHELIRLLNRCERIAATKRYREIATCDLRTAKHAIESLALAEGIKSHAGGCGSTGAVLLAAGAALSYLVLR